MDGYIEMKNAKLFDELFTEVADEQLGLAKVITNVYNAMCNRKKFSVLSELYKDVMGKDRTEERKNFTAEVINNLPYYVLNGSDQKIACDFVSVPENDDEHRQIRAYRFGKGSELMDAVKLDVCVDVISVEREVAVMETITYASGFTKEVPALDAEGKAIKEQGIESYIPRKKTQWGYTPLVKNAIIAALTTLVGE